MRLYGAIQKVEPQDDGTVRVHGIATSEAVDDQGEIVRADAIRAAIPDYMRFPALREMHQLSAAGTTLEAEVGEDGTTRIVAHVVDPVAVAKVKNQVYRGFSIGGRVTQREPGNPKTITGLVLNEISLVDRPANPEAIFDCWKASIMSDPDMSEADLAGLPRELTRSAQDPLAQKPFNSPIQIWACGVFDHRHLAKADALKCMEKSSAGSTEAQTTPAAPAKARGPAAAVEGREDGEAQSSDASQRGKSDSDAEYADPGYQSDGKKRYPIDTDRHIRAAWNYINQPRNGRKYSPDQLKRIKAYIIAAWKMKIDKDGPPSATDGEKASGVVLTKSLGDVGRMVRVILDLGWLKDALDVEAAMENDDSPQPSRLQAIIAELCGFLNALVAEETGEIQSDAEMEFGPLMPSTPGMLAMAAGVSGVERVGVLLQKGNSTMRKLAADLVFKAKHSQGNQALVDVAHHACEKCSKIVGLTVDEKEHMAKAGDHLLRAGAIPTESSSRGATDDAPGAELPATDNARVTGTRVLDGTLVALGKRGRAHQHMMNVAHDCLSELTDGTTCGEAAKAGTRHSTETTDHLDAAHRHLVAAGARCGAGERLGSSPLAEEERQGTEFERGKGAGAGDLAKALAGERAEKSALVKALGEMVPKLDRLTKRVEDIARTPLPPLTIAKGTLSVAKQQDGRSARGGDPELSPEAVASALAKMSKEEQTLTLIKASHANPIRMLSIPEDER